ncbi:MAG: PD-(D/E)XK nuclease family protein [Synergistaceae bacterium]|nr:PD-(D/E)XK nuclease family protein [Synergistaceae bacterium]
MSKKVLWMSNAGTRCDFCMRKTMDAAQERYENRNDEAADPRAAEVGSAMEPLVINWLQRDGWEVERPEGKYVIETEHCIMRGVPDCFLSKGDKRNILADIKTMREDDYKGWKVYGSRTRKPHFVAQLNLYAYAALQAGKQVDWIAIIGVNSNTNEYYVDTMALDDYDMKRTISRIEQVAAAEPADIHPMRNWQCKNCKIQEQCPAMQAQAEADAAYEQSMQLGEAIIESEDPELDNAIQQLKKARYEIAKWHEVENLMKDKIDELVVRRGAKTVYSGRLILEVNEILSQRFDVNKFRKEHQEMLSDFMKPSRALVYKVKEADNYGR